MKLEYSAKQRDGKMNLDEAKAHFIQSWGTLGTQWGINRTMAQVHALLLVSPGSLNADEIMEALNISRGNSNMNIRSLIDWGLVKKELKPGERKEYFYAVKDFLKMAKRIMIMRKRKELEPLIDNLELLKQVQGENSDTEAFRETINGLSRFSKDADKVIQRMIEAEESWLLTTFLKMMSR